MTDDSLNISARDLIAWAKGKPPHICDMVADIVRNLQAIESWPWDSPTARDLLKDQIDKLAEALKRP